jgi:glycosyltransferase involved in cell wall biosynthesis
MARHPQLNLQVAYCSLRGAEAAYDPEFGTAVKWDVPLLDGYDWVEIPNRGSGGEGFFGLYNPGLWKVIRQGRFDAVLCYTGYIRASFWIAMAACRSNGAAMLYGADASRLDSRGSSRWKVPVKKAFWPLLFSLADQVIVPSSATRDLMLSLHIPAERVTLTPYSVDNDWWQAQSQQVDRAAVRSRWGVTPDSQVVLFCAKLQPWKRPLDLLQAFAQANLPRAYLIFAGEGPLRSALEDAALSLGVADRVRFLGFVNQTQLPAIYTAADIMVLPSEYEPFAVVVNEASCCGCPVIASDRVGAAGDLIAPVNPEFIYPCGNIGALAQLLSSALADPARLVEFGQAARRRIETWSPRENIAGTVEAIQRAVDRVRPTRSTQNSTPPSSDS